MPEKTILIVDDEPDVRDIIKRKLNKTYNIIEAGSVDEALTHLSTATTTTVGEATTDTTALTIDLILTDLVMPHRDGLELLHIVTKDYPHIPVIVISGNATLGMVVRAMQNGAADFIEKPIDDLNILSVVIDKVLEASFNKQEIKRLKDLLNQGFDTGKVIGKSLSIQKAMETVKKIAAVDTTVLLCGETGSGKDVFASLIVANSERKDRRYVAVNCGSVPETLLESILFGHKKGSFTSAYRDQIGYFEEANGGTIFLDEITETTLAFQTKLLRVLENKVIRKIGDQRDIPINVRVITATNKDLATEVKKGNFREDLYYRMNVIQINIPPLRERPEDIELLANHFMKELATKYKKPLYRIDPRTYQILLKHHWKGNVRELRNVIEHSVVMATHDHLLPQDLPAYLQAGTIEVSSLHQFFQLEYTPAKELFEKMYLENLLQKTGGNVTEVSKISKIDRKNLYEKLKKLGIKTDDFRPE